MPTEKKRKESFSSHSSDCSLSTEETSNSSEEIQSNKKHKKAAPVSKSISKKKSNTESSDSDSDTPPKKKPSKKHKKIESSDSDSDTPKKKKSSKKRKKIESSDSDSDSDTPKKKKSSKKRKKKHKHHHHSTKTKSRKKRRHRDKTKDAKKKKRKCAPNSYAYTAENLIKNLMGAGSSPASRAIIINSTKTASTKAALAFENNIFYTPRKTHQTTVLTPSQYKSSTPGNGAQTSYVFTPTNSSKFLPSRIIECDDGAMTLFLPENKLIPLALHIPPHAEDWIKDSPIPKVDMNGRIDIKITKETLKKVGSRRKCSQNQLMGNIGAVGAMRKAGIDVPDRSVQYLHFIAHSLIGDKSQRAKNLGIGTKFANAAMELVNPAIKQLVNRKENPLPAVYVSAIPEWVPGFEGIRLLKALTLIIKDGPGDTFQRSAKVRFDTLSMTPVCLTDVVPVKKFILAKFSAPALVLDNDTPAIPVPLQPNTTNIPTSASSKSNKAVPLDPTHSHKKKPLAPVCLNIPQKTETTQHFLPGFTTMQLHSSKKQVKLTSPVSPAPTETKNNLTKQPHKSKMPR